MLTRGAGLGYANIAGIMSAYWQITGFKVDHIASGSNWHGGSGLV